MKRAFGLQTWGRYDAAAEVIQDWMNQGKGDVSHNDFLHFEIAMIYLKKASKRHFAREEFAQRRLASGPSAQHS
jgi:hypothetical protein